MEDLLCGRCLSVAPNELFDRELWWSSDYTDEGLPPGWRMIAIGGRAPRLWRRDRDGMRWVHYSGGRGRH